jgi:hypothetical protein
VSSCAPCAGHQTARKEAVDGRIDRTDGRGRQERALIAGVMALALLLFLGGVAGERHVLATHPAVTEQHTAETGTTQESGGEAGGAAAHPADAGHELVLGIAVDDPAIVAVSVLVWLGLIAALLRIGRRVLPVVLLVAVAACVLDGGEIIRQTGEAQAGLAVLAALVAAAHGAVVVPAARALVRARRSPARGNPAPLQGVG